MGIGGLAPLVGKARALGAHHNGGALRHVVIVILVRILQLGGKNLDAVLLEEGDALLRRTNGCGHAEHTTDTSTNHVGIVHIRQWVAHDEGVNTCCLGTTQDGPKVAWLLYTLQHYNQGVLL